MASSHENYSKFKNFGKIHDGNTLSSLDITDNGKFLITASKNDQIKLWNLKSYKLIYEWKNLTQKLIYTICILQGSPYIFVSGSS